MIHAFISHMFYLYPVDNVTDLQSRVFLISLRGGRGMMSGGDMGERHIYTTLKLNNDNAMGIIFYDYQQRKHLHLLVSIL